MQRLLGLFFLSVLIPTLLAAALVAALFLHQERQSLSRQAADLAQFSAALVGRELVADRRAVQMIARSPTLETTIDETRFRMLGARFLTDEPLWRAVSVSDPAGVRLIDVPRPIAGRPRGRVVEAASHERTVRTARPQVGSIAMGPSGRPAFAVRAPVLHGREVRYVVSIVVDPVAMGRLLNLAKAPAGWTVTVLDDSGRIVTRSEAPQAAGHPTDRAFVAAAQAASRTGKLVQAGDLSIVARPVEGGSWTVVTAFPSRIYARPMTQGLVVLALVATSTLLVAVLLARLARRELTAQRAQLTRDLAAQRLEALGQMTGGVAHDFNNLLTPIIAGLDILSGRLRGEPRNAKLVDAALESAERAKGLMQRLLSFARRQDLAAQDVDLAPLLEGLKPLLQQSVGGAVRVDVEVRQAPLFVRIDPAQLELAILNLAINARDAMPDGGGLTVIAETARARSGGGLKAGPYVRIGLVDTGAGMDEATLRRAAEPFFTTKPVGKGTGLGLSMAHGLAAQSGGALTLKSTLGQGTTVRIWLPPGAPPVAAPEAALAPVVAPDVKVLLVDDDAVVLAATAASLEERGFILTTAGSSEEALGALARARPDVLVTDLAMPNRDGADLAWSARAAQPGLPILVLTGFARPELQLPAGAEVLEKPFRGDDLASKIAALVSLAT
ncbi:ATP-binding protein [Caulobacter endophyticus]|uniref:histidine kinase n=1 Tax=Caulobacter endophyticus TaxID=2172652 RepID=A0A2T9KCK1_9CAUL|nr:ATP-binding protein [Caulobacter endophyticus]PVM93678.1 hybrid sensor histidine kinase/response regulator [Caulobacter endophyticus]